MGASGSHMVFEATKVAVNRGTQETFQALEKVLQSVPLAERFNFHDDAGRTAMHLAACSSSAVPVAILVGSGATARDINRRDANGDTPRTLARRRKFNDCVLLLENFLHGSSDRGPPGQEPRRIPLAPRNPQVSGSNHRGKPVHDQHHAQSSSPRTAHRSNLRGNIAADTAPPSERNETLSTLPPPCPRVCNPHLFSSDDEDEPLSPSEQSPSRLQGFLSARTTTSHLFSSDDDEGPHTVSAQPLPQRRLSGSSWSGDLDAIFGHADRKQRVQHPLFVSQENTPCRVGPVSSDTQITASSPTTAALAAADAPDSPPRTSSSMGLAQGDDKGLFIKFTLFCSDDEDAWGESSSKQPQLLQQQHNHDTQAQQEDRQHHDARDECSDSERRTSSDETDGHRETSNGNDTVNAHAVLPLVLALTQPLGEALDTDDRLPQRPRRRLRRKRIARTEEEHPTKCDAGTQCCLANPEVPEASAKRRRRSRRTKLPRDNAAPTVPVAQPVQCLPPLVIPDPSVPVPYKSKFQTGLESPPKPLLYLPSIAVSQLTFRAMLGLGKAQQGWELGLLAPLKELSRHAKAFQTSSCQKDAVDALSRLICGLPKDTAFAPALQARHLFWEAFTKLSLASFQSLTQCRKISRELSVAPSMRALEQADCALKEYDQAIVALLRSPSDAAARCARQAALVTLRSCQFAEAPPCGNAASLKLTEYLSDTVAQIVDLSQYTPWWACLKLQGSAQEFPTEAHLDVLDRKLHAWEAGPLKALCAAIQRHGAQATTSFAAAVKALQDWLARLLAPAQTSCADTDGAAVQGTLLEHTRRAILSLGALLVWDEGELRAVTASCLEAFPMAELADVLQATFAGLGTIAPAWEKYRQRAQELRSEIAFIDGAARQAECLAARFAASKQKLLQLKKSHLDQEHAVRQLELELSSVEVEDSADAAQLQLALQTAKQVLEQGRSALSDAEKERLELGDDVFSPAMLHFPELFGEWIRSQRLDRVLNFHALGVGFSMMPAVDMLKKYTIGQKKKRFGRQLYVAKNPSKQPCLLLRFEFVGTGPMARFQRQCFTEEVQLLKKLHNPFVESAVASFLDLQTASAYLEVPFYPFITLQEWLAHAVGLLVTGPAGLAHTMHLKNLQRVSACVAQALAYLEREGVGHGNVSPASVAVREDGTAVLTSFGTSLAEELRDETGSLTSTSVELARDAGFVAPELLFALHAPSSASDAFSFGCLLYWLHCYPKVLPPAAKRDDDVTSEGRLLEQHVGCISMIAARGLPVTLVRKLVQPHPAARPKFAEVVLSSTLEQSATPLVEAHLAVPPEWTHGHSGEQQVFLQEMPQALCREVEALMNSTSVPAVHGTGHGVKFDFFQVLSVQRVENPRVWHLYNMERHTAANLNLDSLGRHGRALPSYKLRTAPFRTAAAPALREEANEVYLFHGSTQALEIAKTGFEPRFHGENAGTLYGKGTYFAESSSKADMYEQGPGETHYMILARVVQGLAFRTSSLYNEKVLPFVDASTRLRRYDSLLAEPTNGAFREVVVFDATKAYPQFVVVYNRMIRVRK